MLKSATRQPTNTRLSQKVEDGVGAHYTTPRKRRPNKNGGMFCSELAGNLRSKELLYELHEHLGLTEPAAMQVDGPSITAVEMDDQDVEAPDNQDMGDINDQPEEDLMVPDERDEQQQQHIHFHHSFSKPKMPRSTKPTDELEANYEHWRSLIPSLVHPYLEYENRTTGRALQAESEIDWGNAGKCTSGVCSSTTSTVLCMFMDRERHCKSLVRVFINANRFLLSRSR